jgi:hypothetical protein
VFCCAELQPPLPPGKRNSTYGAIHLSLHCHTQFNRQAQVSENHDSPLGGQQLRTERNLVTASPFHQLEALQSASFSQVYS